MPLSAMLVFPFPKSFGGKVISLVLAALLVVSLITVVVTNPRTGEKVTITSNGDLNISVPAGWEVIFTDEGRSVARENASSPGQKDPFQKKPECPEFGSLTRANTVSSFLKAGSKTFRLGVIRGDQFFGYTGRVKGDYVELVRDFRPMDAPRNQPLSQVAGKMRIDAFLSKLDQASEAAGPNAAPQYAAYAANVMAKIMETASEFSAGGVMVSEVYKTFRDCYNK